MKICLLPGCGKELNGQQKFYCSGSHGAKHRRHHPEDYAAKMAEVNRDVSIGICQNPQCPGPPVCPGKFTRVRGQFSEYRKKYASRHCAGVGRAEGASKESLTVIGLPDYCRQDGACRDYAECFDAQLLGQPIECPGFRGLSAIHYQQRSSSGVCTYNEPYQARTA